MQMTKRQHYLPQFYLRNFTNDQGKVWCYDRFKERIYACNPRDIACENYLYETRWEDANPKLGEFVLPNQMEKKFAEKEGEYSKLLQKIISICSNPQNKEALICSKEEKGVLASFISNMLLRNPWSMKEVDLDCVTDGIMDVEEIKTIDMMLQLMKLGGTKSLVKFASKMVWLDENFDGSIQQESKKDLLSVKYSILKAEKEQFVTSSYPVLGGIDEMSEEKNKVIYFPLHPLFALIYCNTIPYKSQNRIALVSEDEVEFCNKQYFKLNKEQARLIFTKEKKMLEQYIKREQ